VIQRAGLGPAATKFAGSYITDTRRGLQVGVEITPVNRSCIPRQPPLASSDFLVGGVERVGAVATCLDKHLDHRNELGTLAATAGLLARIIHEGV